MSDFNIRADSVDVEQIMEQIRSRIRDKRGVDYTEEQIRELAQVKLDKILDPRGVRSDLLETFRRQRPPYEPPVVAPLELEDLSFESHRPILRTIRRLLSPILKLFFNPAVFVQALQMHLRALKAQQAINAATLEREVARERQRRDIDSLQFEVMHNLVFELTRTGIEVKNLRMRVEALSSRVDFIERRERSLESAVVYKPSAGDRFEAPAPREARPPAAPEPLPPAAEVAAPAGEPSAAAGAAAEGPGQRSRRRRRRRGRRGRVPAAVIMGGGGTTGGGAEAGDAEAAGEDAAEHDSNEAPDADGPGGDEGSSES